MTLEAVWTVYRPGERATGDSTTLRTPADVDAFVAKLNEPNVSDALITHSARGTVEFEGDQVEDHSVSAGVHEGYGYLTYGDTDHEFAYSVGEPASPEYPSHYADYDAGAGVPLDVLRKALVEFLGTARRPTCVEWRTLEL